MKFKTTIKAVRENANNLVSVGYCDLQFLLRGVDAIAYTSGIYGWNFDVYEVDGTTICTGYRGMPGRRANNASEYNKKAQAIWEDYKRPYDERAADIANLLHEFVAQA